MTSNTRAALFMMVSMAAFTVNDTLIKLAGADVPLPQLLTLRGLLASVLIYGLARFYGGLRFDLSRRDWAFIGLRTVGEISATFFFLNALMNMPIANLNALMQSLPLAVTLGAALFFGEKVGWRRYTAIGLGFCGMLLIVRPGPDGFSLDAVYGLISVACVTLRDLATRKLSDHVPSLTVALSAAVSVACLGLVGSITTEWVPLDLRLGLLVVNAAVFVFFGYLFSILVMRTGEVSFSAPFRYTGLLWALLLGWLVFGHWPDAVTLLGAGVVVASGLFTFYRERVVQEAD
ncbi:DMT family transporter [Seohaeicola zhoushanensis]|uniref:Membrane protein n=1 Tax=Seohaeicola zhoushanensis TaxID=1569283 RepID=A0A8J3H1C5_9RHOB|nr:DMT family transporter [Seohaeicola zhoushanensis]GHF70492.1 membrane protein [Seohaeicola zhoushanensis]